jgi:ornithine cyclodeaminase/alanine dehydrogenase-like protein (mu-crystallin family)
MGDGQEVSDAVYRRADVLMADDWEQVATRQDIARLVTEGVVEPSSVVSLWEVVAGIRPGRLRPTDIVLMRSQGLVIQDVAIGRYVYDECIRAGLGRTLDSPANG